ncbi:MAG: tricarballylate utilization protein TcuB [Terriglobia bacterium]|nr:MAG: tricarballylate utilization protein TcuB [Terriglobia bacterium]
MPQTDSAAEGARILTICNACRYCEGYCAVFPAMEHRRAFAGADLNFLANLCHNCAECYYACQYAPPHAFAVNVPRVLAEIRAQSYRQYAWSNGRYTAGVFALGAVLAFVFARSAGPRFYDVIPHAFMVAVFGTISGFVLAALAIGAIRSAKEFGVRWDTKALARAAADVLTLEYLRSGGAGCTYPTERHSGARRWFHHCTFYGFLLCFASTTVAALYHYGLGRLAPYPYTSLPVLLGTFGGVGLLVGPAGLYWLKRRRDPATADANQNSMDLTFLSLLFATSLTGLLLLVLRASSGMAPMLLIHLALVAALFATLPYGKFVHGIYRSLALLRYALEQRGGR